MAASAALMAEEIYDLQKANEAARRHKLRVNKKLRSEGGLKVANT